MTDNFFKELTEELQNGVIKKAHPFRYFTLGTVGLDRMARLRTVVLRNIADDLKLTFFTDDRSKKIIHLKENKHKTLSHFEIIRKLETVKSELLKIKEHL